MSEWRGLDKKLLEPGVMTIALDARRRFMVAGLPVAEEPLREGPEAASLAPLQHAEQLTSLHSAARAAWRAAIMDKLV